MGYPTYPDAVPAGVALDQPTPVRVMHAGTHIVEVSYEVWQQERAERNRIARECADATQERDRLQELVNRLRPLAQAAIAEDIAEELHDEPGGNMNPLIVGELAEARADRRLAVAHWHDQQADDRAEGRTPLDVTG